MRAISRRGLFRTLAALPSAWRLAAGAGAALAGMRILLLESEVAGMAHYDAERVLPGLAAGQRLALRREPGNRHDALAIEVLAPGGAKLGYVPRLHNPPLARLMDAGKPLHGEIVEIGLPLSDYVIEDHGATIHILNAGPRPRRVGYGELLMAVYLAD